MVCCFRYLESNSQKCQSVSIDLVLHQLHHKNSTNRSPEWFFYVLLASTALRSLYVLVMCLGNDAGNETKENMGDFTIFYPILK